VVPLNNPVLKHPLFLIVVLINCLGPFFTGFGNWANVIQYTGGFTIAYAIGYYFIIHKKTIKDQTKLLEKQIEQLAHLKEHGITHHVVHDK
jgi:hypothetical protein